MASLRFNLSVGTVWFWFILSTLDVSHALNITTSQLQTTIAPDTNSNSTEIVLETDSFPEHWVMLMIVFGFIGCILIPLMCIHSMVHFTKSNIIKAGPRVFYAIFFAGYFCTCIGYTFFRTDLILPMGSSISCTFGYYFSTNSVYFSKSMLLAIFIYRIDLAFHASAMGYSRSLLLCIIITLLTCTTSLNVLFIFVTKDIVAFEEASYFNGAITGMCTSGSGDSKYGGLFTLVLGLLFLGDMIANIILCVLFTYKLRVVIRMGADCSSQDRTLQKLMRKQTVLVLVACVTSMVVLGLGAVLSGFSLIMPLDATVNAFCIWLMFSFSDPIWNKITHCFCFCCYCDCCGHKDDFMMTLRTIRGLSLRDRDRDVPSCTQTPSVGTTNNFQAKFADINVPEPITERVSEKHIEIEIKFDNDLTSADLKR